MMIKSFLTSMGLCVCFALSGQTDQNQVIPFIKTGVGYFNDELMIDGSVLWSEAGIRLSNNYTFSLNYKFGETLNDKGSVWIPGIQSAELILTEKIFTLFMGYEFTGKRGKHSFMPQIGPFYSVQNYHNMSVVDGSLIIKKDSFEDIGVGLELCYMYNFHPKISIGLNCSGYVAYQMGPLYYTISPLIAIRL